MAKLKTDKTNFTPNKRTKKLLDRAMKEIKAGKNMSKIFTDMKEMDEYLSNL